MFKKACDLIDRTVQIMVALMVLGILIATLLQVISRYVFNSPFMWTEELARALGIWLVLLCSGIVVREGRHLGFDIFPQRWKPILQLITNLSIILFSGALIKGSIQFALVGIGINSSALDLPLWFLYSSIPLGFFLMFIFASEATKELILRFRENKVEEKS